MTWNGEERRSGKDRRLAERRRTMPYNVTTLVVIDSITWIDAQGSDRRSRIRRREDREELANKVIQYTRP
jgi:hypothetical protein